MNKKLYKKIGVLGGMGPDASAAFYGRMIELFQSIKKARHNDEFPEKLVHNIPSPDNVEAGVDDELRNYLVRGARLLEKAGIQSPLARSPELPGLDPEPVLLPLCSLLL